MQRVYTASLCIAGLNGLASGAARRQRLAFTPGTWANKLSHIRVYLLFTAHFALLPFPASLTTLLLFLEFLANSYSSPKAVADTLASVKFYHERGGFTLTNFTHLQLRLALRSLPLTMRVHAAPAPPFPAALLRPLLGAARVLGVWALPFRALILFAFFSFARLASLVPARASPFDPSRFPVLGDLWLGGGLGAAQGDAFLRLKHSKTRQSADGGFSVPFLRSHTLPCPVRMAEQLLQAAERVAAPLSTPLFATFQSARPPFPALSQDRARRLLRATLTDLGLPPHAFTFHSLRRGGCTHAFAEGAVESDLALHGDWRSQAIRTYYPRGLAQLRVARVLADSPSSSA